VPPPPSISGPATSSPRLPVVPGRGGLVAPGRPGTAYQGGNYGELQTEAITGVVVSGGRDSSLEMSGTLAGHLLSRGAELSRKRERQRRMRTFGWVTFALVMFAVGIAVVVNILAGDFLSAVIETFANFAG
jgi:hypothetical protein